MNDKDKTKEQLIKELAQMRQQTAEREAGMANNSEKWLQDLANNLTIGLYIVQDGKFVFANPMFRKYVGYSEYEMNGMNSLSLVSPEDRDMVWKNAVKMLKRERSSPYEFRCISKSGDILYCLETVTSVQYQGRRAAMGSFVDVTERKQMEEALKESEDRLRATVMNAPIGIATSGVDRYFLSANEAFCRILGYTEAELQKMSFKDITHPEDIKVSIAWVDGIDVGKVTSFGQEKRYIKKDGKVIIGKVMVNVVRDHEGKPYLYIAELEDITERKQLEEKHRQLIEDMGDGYLVIQESKCVFANNRFSEIFGYKPGQVIGKPIAQFIMPDVRQMQMERHGRVERGEEAVPEQREGRGMKEDGSIVLIESNTKAIQYNGKPAFAVITRDITPQKSSLVSGSPSRIISFATDSNESSDILEKSC